MDNDERALVEGRRFTVTGGAGFIGSWLVERLLRSGAAHVTVIDNLRYGDPTWIQSLAGRDRLTLLRFDLGTDDCEVLDPHLDGADGLFHLAAEKHNQALGRPVRVLRANIEGTLGLFERAAQRGVAKTVFTSSLYAHGRMAGPPMREDERAEPRTVYGISKLAGEHLLSHVHGSAGLPHTVLRLYFVYGPRQFQGSGYKSVIVRNFERILGGEPPLIRGDGNQALDYVYVDDVVTALVRSLDSATSGALLNVGSGRAVRIIDLTRAMLEVAESDLEPTFGEPDVTAGSHRVCVNDRACRVLGWKPRVDLTRGLRKVYDWLRNERRSAQPS